VVNKSINVLRKRKLQTVDIDFTMAAEVPDEKGPDEQEIQYKVEEVKKAIQQLPDGYRTVLSLYLLEGYDHEEISQILKLAESTVRTQYMRAKQKLIHIIKTEGTHV
jgi:RNA polymerase sigma-70 factor (ECF subfamily)